MVRLQLFMLGLACAIAADCFADAIVLDNGDRLTGRITRLEHGKLVLDTSYAGEVKIDLGKIQSLQTDALMTVEMENKGRVYGILSGNGTQLIVQDKPGTTPIRIPVGQVTDIVPGRVTGEEWKVAGHVNVGASESSGNTDVTRVHGDGEIVARKGKDRYIAGAAVNYTKDTGIRTEANAMLYGKHDTFFTKRWYRYVNTTLEHDRFKDIRLRNTLGFGNGYQAIESSRTNLALEAGLEYVYTDFYQAPTQHFPAARLAVRFDRYLIPDAVQLFHKSEGYVSLQQIKQSFARTQTGLRFPLRDNFVMTTQLNVDWDGDPQSGRESTDRTWLLTLGYRW